MTRSTTIVAKMRSGLEAGRVPSPSPNAQKRMVADTAGLGDSVMLALGVPVLGAESGETAGGVEREQPAATIHGVMATRTIR